MSNELQHPKPLHPDAEHWRQEYLKAEKEIDNLKDTAYACFFRWRLSLGLTEAEIEMEWNKFKIENNIQ